MPSITKTGVLIDTNRSFNNPQDFNVRGQTSSIVVSGLNSSTQYYVKAYIEYDNETIYSTVDTFITSGVQSSMNFLNNSGQSRIFQIEKNGSPANPITLDWSKDGETWTTWTSSNGDLSITVNDGETVQIHGNNSTFSDNYLNYYRIRAPYMHVTGNIMSLLDSSGLSTTIPSGATFCRLFYNNPNTTFDIVLPATTLSPGCYWGLFERCSSLTNAPALPAASLATTCYYEMFYECTSLVDPPAIAAEYLAPYCFYGMFRKCSSLSRTISLPYTTLEPYCYGFMYDGCSSITEACELPATTLSEYCYRAMFRHTNIRVCPELPATTLAIYCYKSMFEGCENIYSPPELPVTNIVAGCYSDMFAECSNLLTCPELPATIMANYCYYAMFRGCTKIEEAPNIPNTNIRPYCFGEMFKNDVKLKKAPVIRVQPVAEDCYQQMFMNCSLLDKIEFLGSSWDSNNTAGWLDNVATTGDFYNLGGATIPTGVSGIPASWTVHTSL